MDLLRLRDFEAGGMIQLDRIDILIEVPALPYEETRSDDAQ